MPEWAVTLLTAAAGALIGSAAGITYVVRLALTEQLRAVFVDKKDAVTEVALLKKAEELRAQAKEEMVAFTENVRRDFQTTFGTAAERIQREHQSLRDDLNRALGALDNATKALQQEGVTSAQQVAAVREQGVRVEDLNALYGALNTRLGHVEKVVEDIKGQLGKVLGEIAKLPQQEPPTRRSR